MMFLQSLPFNLGAFDMASFGRILLWGTILIVTITIISVTIRNKLKYVYHGIVLRRRQDTIDGIPQAVVLQGKAGYFSKKNGKVVFRVKYGLMPWQVIETTDTPNPEHMIGNMAIFFQLDKDNVLQAKTVVDWEGKAGNMKLVPVKDDLKFHHRIHMSEIDQILDTKKISPMVIGMTIMGLIIVTGIIVFYFLGKA